MNILHLSQWDNVGGSGRAAYRLHSTLRARGHTSRMLVGRKATGDSDVALLADGWRRFLDLPFQQLCEAISLQYMFQPSSFLLAGRRWFQEADLIQVYNTHGGYFSHTAIPFLSKRKPVIWRLSDMWPFTGHCAYPRECERWLSGCGECPIVTEYPSLRRDTTRWLWRWKKLLYRASRLTFVAPSQWIQRQAYRSPLISRFRIEVIPNGLDVDLFKPYPKRLAREILGVPPDAKVLAFSAHSLEDRRKGGDLLISALRAIPEKERAGWMVLLSGAGSDRLGSLLPLPSRALGPLADDRILALAYSAADVFVLPTLADNLPNGAIESLACGTPVLSFDVGGVGEVVRHRETGWLVRGGDVKELTGGLSTMMADSGARIQLGENGRKLVEQEFSAERQAERFESLYESVRTEWTRTGKP